MLRFPLLAAFLLALASRAGAAPEVPPVSFDDRSFLLAGRPVFVWAAGFDYVRCPRALWDERLLAIRRAGFNAVSSPVPWNWHEREEGRADFSDLDAWLAAAERAGLLVILRIGPWIGNGWNAGGIPGWLAGRAVGWRTGTKASMKWSGLWYRSLARAVGERQAGNGGPVILVQLESGGDDSGVPAEATARQLSALEAAARKRDIGVPLVVCRSRAVLARPDAGKRPIVDGEGFGAGATPKDAAPALAALRRDQPGAPLAVLALSVSPTAAAADAMVWTLVAAGASAIVVDPACAGAAQGYWGAPGLPTTWGPDAPVNEAGGLAPSWDSLKLAGDFMAAFGPWVARAVPSEPGPADPKGTLVRADGSARLEVRAGPRATSVGLAGLEAHGLVVDRCAARVQSVVRQGTRRVLLLADAPGAWKVSARLDGDPAAGTVSWGTAGKLSVLQGRVAVWGQPRERAARTWVIETSRGAAIVSCGRAFLRHHDERGGRLSLRVDAPPGSDILRVLVPGSATRLTEVPFWTRNLPLRPVRLDAFRVAPERPGDGADWTKLEELASLGELGRDAEGFHRYRARFEWNGEPALALEFLDRDPRFVLVNGTMMTGLSGTATSVAELLAPVAKRGENIVEILLENRGRPDSGPGMDAPKGLVRAALAGTTVIAESGGTPVNGWEVSSRLARGWERGDGGDWIAWKPGTPLPAAAAAGPVTWYRAQFTLVSLPGWNVAWKLVLKSKHDARIFLNGVQVGNYAAGGPQSAFFLADPLLKYGSLGNELAIAVLRGAAPAAPVSASIEPYAESASYTHTLEVPLPDAGGRMETQ